MQPRTPWIRVASLLLLSGAAAPACADVTILVHGYFSGENAWQQNGITDELTKSGWQSGGSMTVDARGVLRTQNNSPKDAQRIFHLADLPSEAPLQTQAKALHEILSTIRKNRGPERTILVGHSAGGVVARLLMVRKPESSIHTLITIASPHLGTDKAEMAGLLASTPLSMMAPMVGLNTLNRSRTLYAELERERPGNFLHWLNHQPHPKANYLSIVRRDAFALSGDNTVPVWSQDMAKVHALREYSPQSISQGTDHALERQDGVTVARLLAGL
ncbi:MAG: alpha/beta fold hydrolase [Magnetococcales bacterium]|nr:alpha/beta fold hydrolase [Magnetococcales bacterium]